MTIGDKEKVQLGSKIKRLRAEKNISQNWLAKQIGVRAQNISKYEKGESIPSAILLKRIANVLGVTADSLLSDNGVEERVVKVEDVELLKKIELLDQMDEEDRNLLKGLLDLALLKHSVKKLQTA